MQRGGLESVGAGGDKATMGVLWAELEQANQLLAKGQEEMKQEMKGVKEEVLADVKPAQGQTKQEVQATKQEVQEVKHELTVLAAVQEESNAQISALDRKIDRVFALMSSTGGSER
jgi:septal ring factor EnvC (AmiA/AmiB activator)